jgi:type I restriction enzyme, S subunit
MMPDGWKLLPLTTIAEVRTGISKNGQRKYSDPVQMPYLRVANVQDGHLNLSEMKTITIERSEVIRYLLQDGDVLLTEGGDFDKLGRGAVWQSAIRDCVHQNHVFVVRTYPDFLLPSFLSALTGSTYGKAYFVRCSKQSTNLASINSSQLKAFPVLLPPLREQHAIIKILSPWDHAIDLTTQLIAAKQKRKSGLMQQLLMGKKRFPEFNEHWQTVTIGDFLSESRINGSDGRTARKITVKLYGKGVLPKEERNSGSEATRYYQRRAGQFIYSKLDFLNGAFGIIPPEMNGYESTLDLPCFDFIEDIILPQFFLYFVSRESFYSRYASAALGGRKARRIQVEEFLASEIEIPKTEEQEKIVVILSCCDQELVLLNRKLALLKKQKQGLMQQLLTGRIRVKT